MEIITVRVDASLVAAVFLVILFYHELTALGTIHVNGLEVADKVTFWVIGATVEFLATSLCLSGNNLSGTTRPRTTGQGDGTGAIALRETRAGQEKAESSQLLYHGTTALVAQLVGGLVHGALQAFVGGHYGFHLVSEGEEKITQHLRPLYLVLLNLVQFSFHTGGEIFVYHLREGFHQDVINDSSKGCGNKLLVAAGNILAVQQHGNNGCVGGRATNALFFQGLYDGGIGVAGWSLGKVLLRIKFLGGKLFSHLQ